MIVQKELVENHYYAILSHLVPDLIFRAPVSSLTLYVQYNDFILTDSNHCNRNTYRENATIGIGEAHGGFSTPYTYPFSP